MADPGLKAPFSWFGGKSRVADVVWRAFGDVANYVEPFGGSLAVLLGRPGEATVETVNDMDCYIANFWRAVQADPVGVVKHCNWPVNEADKHARHKWLVDREFEFRERIMSDPHYYDLKIAGWWVWGLCLWIGSGWCSKKKPSRQIPALSGTGNGIHALGYRDMNLHQRIQSLSKRLRYVRVACGDWSRILGPSITTRMGLTAVFLDPPYDGEEDVYRCDGRISSTVREWALAHGNDPLFRIALCGYEGEHVMPKEWVIHAWKANGGYGNRGQGQGRVNAGRERIWFSPHCLPLEKERSTNLFPEEDW